VTLDRQRVVTLGTTTITMPATPSRGQVTVRTVSGVVRKGAAPVGDVVQIASNELSFAPAARMRQSVAPAPPGRSYVAVTASATGTDAWVTKGAATVVTAATIDEPVAAQADAGSEPRSVYQIDVTSAGLWAIALVDETAPGACSITAPSGCAANESCTLGCGDAGPVLSCQLAGTKKEGEVCSTGECEPGTQCMRTACGVSLCNRLCRTDAACGAVRCLTVPISCSVLDTDVRVCAHPCDPTGTAQTGCVPGLRCLMFPGEIPSCDCAVASRTKGDGEACATGDDCLPGFFCVANETVGGTGSLCRALCTLGGTDCAAPRTCTMIGNPAFKTWGVCTP
jgi:hypothetical protein